MQQIHKWAAGPLLTCESVALHLQTDQVAPGSISWEASRHAASGIAHANRISKKKGKLLKNLIICLAFQISALGFFHGSTEYERIAQFCHGTREMSVKKKSAHTAKPEKKLAAPGTRSQLLCFPGQRLAHAKSCKVIVKFFSLRGCSA